MSPVHPPAIGAPATRPSPATRQCRAARVVGWSFVVLGCGHLLTVAGAAAGDQDPTVRRAMDGLRAVRVSLPGPRPTLAELFDGYSLMMALMVMTGGLLVLLIARHGRTAPGLVRSMLRLTAGITAVGSVVAWLLLPLPPIIGFLIAFVASLVGIGGSRSEVSDRGSGRDMNTPWGT